MATRTIGIIGGSGLETLFDQDVPHSITTPIGTEIEWFEGPIEGVPTIFVPRHGTKHQNLPIDVPYEEIMKLLIERGVSALVAFSATGCLDLSIPLPTKEQGSFIVPNDYIRGKWGQGYSLRKEDYPHADVSIPFDQKLRSVLIETGRKLGYHMHDGGIYVFNHGDQFETKAEVAERNAIHAVPTLIGLVHNLYQILTIMGKQYNVTGMDELSTETGRLVSQLTGIPGLEYLHREGLHVGMTTVPETILAEEAGIPYAVVCTPVNYGVGMVDTPATHEETMRVMEYASAYIHRLVNNTIPLLGY